MYRGLRGGGGQRKREREKMQWGRLGLGNIKGIVSVKLACP